MQKVAQIAETMMKKACLFSPLQTRKILKWREILFWKGDDASLCLNASCYGSGPLG